MPRVRFSSCVSVALAECLRAGAPDVHGEAAVSLPSMRLAPVAGRAD